MLKVEILSIGLGTVCARFFLMMAVIIAAGFSGYWGWAILGLPIFLSAILGVSVRFTDQKAERIKKLPTKNRRSAA
ncbi:MAG: hypothetical protein AAGD05_12055 [Bacteroidota bacterium]